MSCQKERAKDHSNIHIDIYLNWTFSKLSVNLNSNNTTHQIELSKLLGILLRLTDSCRYIKIVIQSQSTLKSSSLYLSASDLRSMSGMLSQFRFLTFSRGKD